jgi:hypothetical protein
MSIKHLTVLSFPYAYKGKQKPSYNIDTSYLYKGSTVHHNIMVEEDSELGSLFKDLTELIQEYMEKQSQASSGG